SRRMEEARSDPGADFPIAPGFSHYRCRPCGYRKRCGCGSRRCRCVCRCRNAGVRGRAYTLCLFGASRSGWSRRTEDRMSRITYREAVREAIRDALRKDSRVFLMGEDVGAYGGCYAVTKGLLDEFGPERIRDTPLSESAFVGAGIGAALGGMRPIVEVMTVNFSLLALDQILN